jgi:hypothetical protein
MLVRLSKALSTIFFGLSAAISLAQGIPGVAVSATTVFAPDPSGGIQAINIKDGSIAWQSRTADWPVGFGGGKLVAITNPGQGNKLEVCFFNPDSGRTVASMGPIELAPWAKASLDIGAKSSSDFAIWIASKWVDGMVLHWRAERWTAIDIRNLRKPQTQQVAAGRILIGFNDNSVESHQIPPTKYPPAATPADKSLPMLRGQRALSSVSVGDSTIALVQAGSDLTLQCFRQQMFQWSKPVGTKHR